MMLAPKFNFSLCLALALVVSPAALCADYHSQKGYSLTYPEGWAVLPKAATAALSNAVKKNVGDATGANLDVTICDPTNPGMLINVATVPSSLTITPWVSAGYLDGFKESLGKNHLQSKDLDCKIVHLGRRALARLTGLIESDQPWKHYIQIRQYVIPGGTSTYILTGISPAGSPTTGLFDKVAGSFRLG